MYGVTGLSERGLDWLAASKRSNRGNFAGLANCLGLFRRVREKKGHVEGTIGCLRREVDHCVCGLDGLSFTKIDPMVAFWALAGSGPADHPHPDTRPMLCWSPRHDIFVS